MADGHNPMRPQSPLFGKIRNITIRRCVPGWPIEVAVYDDQGRERVRELDEAAVIRLIESCAHALAMGDG